MKKILITLIISAILVSCGKPEDYLVIIKTEYGDMTLALFDETPLHKANFIKLAQEGAYDSTIFHRVIENFMIQGGDVNRKEGATGSISYTVPAEIQEKVSGKFMHTKGALAAARLGDSRNPKKASSGCQFYIVDGTTFDREAMNIDQGKLNTSFRKLLTDPKFSYLNDSIQAIIGRGGRNKEINDFVLNQKSLVEEHLNISVTLDFTEEQLNAYSSGDGGSPHLDGGYTVFGRVVEGMEVIDKIAAVQKNGEKPVDKVGMVVELKPITKKELRKKYKELFPESSN